MYCVPCELFWGVPRSLTTVRDCGSELVPTKEEAYFLRMSKYQKQLEDYIEAEPELYLSRAAKKKWSTIS